MIIDKNMKKTLILLLALTLVININAQVPAAFGYTAVIRDVNRTLITERAIGMRVSILRGIINSDAIYEETHKATTDAHGLVSIVIGKGTVTEGSFDDIDWSASTYFVKVETDTYGGEHYLVSSTSQLLSVPYALHAKTADFVSGSANEQDPLFSNWNRSTGISITKSQITDLENYVENEVDPLFSQWDKTTGIKISKHQILDYDNIVENESDPAFSSWSRSYNDLINAPDISNLHDRIAHLEKMLLGIGSFTDTRDGTTYRTIRLDNHIWMAENLKYLPSVNPDNDASIDERRYYVYGYSGTDVYAAKETDNYKTYGVLYNWTSAVEGGICPSGWHVPNVSEWNGVLDVVGSYTTAGDKLKEKGTKHWIAPNTNATDEVHFTALPGGYFDGENRSYVKIGVGAYWWTSEGSSATEAESAQIYASDAMLNILPDKRIFGFSVRCIKDY